MRWWRWDSTSSIGPTNVFNFAQGDLVMLGAMFGATFITLLGLPWFVGAALAMLAVAALALVEEKIAVAPVLNRSATGHGWVITTLAVSMIFANLVGLGWGPDPIAVPPPAPLSTETFELFGANISSYQIAVMVITVVLVLGVEAFYGTRSGKAVLAVAEDRDAALLRGINPNRLSSWSFFLGGGVAALTGVLAAPVLYASTGARPVAAAEGLRRGGGGRHRQQSRRADGGLHHRHRRGAWRRRCCRPATSSPPPSPSCWRSC